MKHARVALYLLAAVSLAAAAGAQDKPPAAPPGGMPAPAQPSPEHSLLKGDVGTWDATVETLGPPGAPVPPPSKGVETNTLLGGLWLVTDFKGDVMGAPFGGHGISGWDPSKKKYVSVWTDTMSTGMMTGESSYDAGKKTLTGWMEGRDHTGTPSKMTSVVEYKDADTRVFTMGMAGPDGKSTPVMRITYKRRK